jgi:CRP/FNR family transcriptional regulator, anaerobic regulatory protein
MNAAAGLALLPRSAALGVPARKRKPASVARLRTPCQTCNLRELCLPAGMEATEMARLEDVVRTRRRIARGAVLYRAGADFEALYAVRSGFFKSSVVLEDGREQVTAFHMAGELMGMDGIGHDRHAADVVALEDSEVCVIAYGRLEEAGLERQLHKVMSRELVRGQGVMMLLGTMRAEERLAAFLLNLSQRFMARGYSPSDFHLRMTREEIGSYMGLSLETVSRLFSRFQAEGLVAVQQKHIRILDVAGLRGVMYQNRE